MRSLTLLRVLAPALVVSLSLASAAFAQKPDAKPADTKPAPAKPAPTRSADPDLVFDRLVERIIGGLLAGPS